MITIATRLLTARERQDMLLWITKNIDVVVDSSDDIYNRWWCGNGWRCQVVVSTDLTTSKNLYELEIEDDQKAMELALRWA